MKRRGFIKVAGVSALISTAGCISGNSGNDGNDGNNSRNDEQSDNENSDNKDRSDTDNQTDDGGSSKNFDYFTHVFDTGIGNKRVIDGGIKFKHDVNQYYVTLIGSAEETSRFNYSAINDENVKKFVDNTNFDQSYLIVIQTEPASSSPDYRVESIERKNSNLKLSINDSSKGGTADLTVETVLVRISDPEVPKKISVTTEDGTTFDSTEGVKTVPNPGMKDGHDGDEKDDDDTKKDCDSMHDSVIEVEYKKSSLDDAYVPIEFSDLTPGEKKILKNVTKTGEYTTCDASDAFNHFVKRVSKHRRKQSDSSEDLRMVYIKHEDKYYGLYVEKLDQVYSNG